MANNMLKALQNVAGKTKAIVVDKASDALSAPARAYYGAKSAQADRDTKILKGARAAKGSPQFDGKGNPTQGFQLQTLADEVIARRSKK